MYCQKCRVPLKIDSTLDDLNPAAFDLLVGSAVKAQQNVSTSSRVDYPSERQALYDKVSKQGAVPLQRRTIPAPHGDHGLSNGGKSDVDGAHPPDMSFIEITQSQVVGSGRDSVTNGKDSVRDESPSQNALQDGQDGEIDHAASSRGAYRHRERSDPSPAGGLLGYARNDARGGVRGSTISSHRTEPVEGAAFPGCGGAGQCFDEPGEDGFRGVAPHVERR